MIYDDVVAALSYKATIKRHAAKYELTDTEAEALLIMVVAERVKGYRGHKAKDLEYYLNMVGKNLSDRLEDKGFIRRVTKKRNAIFYVITEKGKSFVRTYLIRFRRRQVRFIELIDEVSKKHRPKNSELKSSDSKDLS